jgi:hypothetical protein
MKTKLIFAVIGFLFFVTAEQVFAKAELVNSITYYMETTTDDNGHFDVPHGLPATDDGEGMRIVGAIVSVQHPNRGWYPVYATSGGSRVAWDAKNVSAVFPDKDFKKRPVRILLFTTQILQ